jgi:ABC-type transporter Mla subunit MlaD
MTQSRDFNAIGNKFEKLLKNDLDSLETHLLDYSKNHTQVSGFADHELSALNNTLRPRGNNYPQFISSTRWSIANVIGDLERLQLPNATEEIAKMQQDIRQNNIIKLLPPCITLVIEDIGYFAKANQNNKPIQELCERIVPNLELLKKVLNSTPEESQSLLEVMNEEKKSSNALGQN